MNDLDDIQFVDNTNAEAREAKQQVQAIIDAKDAQIASMQAVIDAAREVLVWHDENLTDGVNREYVIRELRAKLAAVDGDK